MRAHSLADPRDYRFARAGRRGTWSPGTGVCPECTASTQDRIAPLVIEWLPDSDVVGDFTWPGFNDEVVVSQRVRDSLEGLFHGMEFRPVEMIQERSLKRPKRPTKRSRPRVWLPYEGELVWDFQPTEWVELDLGRSGITISSTCSTCGNVKYEGIPRENRHLVVDKSTWSGADFFRIRDLPLMICCTQEVVDFIQSKGFTNFGSHPGIEIA